MAKGRGNRGIVANGPRLTVRDWPATERPRERLLKQGPQSLSEAELLAVFLRIGLPGQSVLDLARSAIERFGSLNGLLNAPADAIQAMPGFGPAKCAQLLAVIELARRALKEDVRRQHLLDSPPKVRDYLQLRIGRLPHEVFAALFLDAQNRLIDDEELFRGTLTQTSVYPREVVKRALARNAAAVIFAHNHPSGLAEPSRADELLTRTLRDALALVDVRVLDHVIVAGASSVSFAERGLL
jgi:DNA repair protein RadC